MEKILEQLRKEARGIANTTAHFMKLAENYIAEENFTAARACLLLLCEKCDNYEESIEWNGLSEQWQNYRYLVAGMVPPSVTIMSTKPRSPAECTIQITDILSLPDEEMLSTLSDHLGELSGNGDALNALNKWERTVYYVDELCVEVNSGGFDSYLYYHGIHFMKAYQSIVRIGAEQTLQLMNRIQCKFPRNCVPKAEGAIQNAMDRMDEDGIDFNDEDEIYYSSAEKELLDRLLMYVRENEKHFR